MTKILLIGNGAREHAIAKVILNSAENPELYAYMSANNPGITELSMEVKIGKYDDLEEINAYGQALGVDFAVIGPEAPLDFGVVDALEKVGIPSVGPKKVLAALETSKNFARSLMSKYKIEGNPEYKTFESIEGVKEFIEELGEFVVKPDGLTGGKGVKVSGEHLMSTQEGVKYCEEVLEKHPRVVIEEKFIGEEFSLMSFCDGKNIVDCVPVQDHKRAYEDDTGPNTGGMGSYSDANHLLPFLKKEHIEAAHEITQKMCDAMREEYNVEYKGVMYGGFIITKNGVKLIEYNARLGDPEAMNVLSILESDFVELCRGIISGHLDEYEIVFSKKATVCKYVVPEGYPDNPVKDEKIEVIDVVGVEKYFASVDMKEDGLYMSGSRAIAFVGIGDTLNEAEQIAERAVGSVTGKVFHRPDIGTEKLIQKRIDHMKNL